MTDQQPHLEAHLDLELGRRHRRRGPTLELRGLGRPDGSSTTAGPPELGQRLDPHPRHHLRRRSPPQHRQSAHAGGVVPDLGELGEPDVHQAEDPLADLALLPDQAHGKAGGLAQLRPHQGLAGWRLVDHGERRQCARIGGVALAPLQPALAEVLRLQRVDHRHRIALAAEVTGQVEPVMAARLHDHPRHRLRLPPQPGIEIVEPSPIGGDLQPPAFRLPRPLAAHRHGMAGAPDVNPHGDAHPGASLSGLRPRGVPADLRHAWADAPSPVPAVGSPSPLEGEERGPVTSRIGRGRIAGRRSPRQGSSSVRF